MNPCCNCNGLRFGKIASYRLKWMQLCTNTWTDCHLCRTDYINAICVWGGGGCHHIQVLTGDTGFVIAWDPCSTKVCKYREEERERERTTGHIVIIPVTRKGEEEIREKR